ncbi:hypothetical protein GCM10017673_03950 [Streptosporangium violaceochromogenes]|nr:hypothetical protein GCM10017673_03950 [Streptosporangium violaceochromogenes]
MRWIVAAVVLLTVGAAGPAVVSAARAAGGEVKPVNETTVSEEQYETLLSQCRYADTAALRAECRATVRARYRVGAENPDLDCRTYSGVTVCGELELAPAERRCVKEAVEDGLGRRRAEVECYAFS